MNKIVLIALMILFLIGCKEKPEQSNQQSQENNVIKKEFVEPINDKNTKVPFYIINISAANTDTAASDIVIEKRKKYAKVNYLWIPDYESLSGKEMYAVFLGPYPDIESVMFELLQHKAEDKNAYAVLVNHEYERFVIFDRFDIRRNNIKQKLLFFYSDNKFETEYYEDNYESDLGWLTLTQAYFYNNHTDSVFMPVYEDWLLQEEKIDIIKDLGKDPFSMGYLLVNDNRKTYIYYDEFDVLDTICDFFGLSSTE